MVLPFLGGKLLFCPKHFFKTLLLAVILEDLIVALLFWGYMLGRIWGLDKPNMYGIKTGTNLCLISLGWRKHSLLFSRAI